MWLQCTVSKILPLRQGTSKSGSQYKVIDLDLEWPDLNDQGNPIIDASSRQVHSTVRVSALNDLADFLITNNVQPGSSVWAELHFFTTVYEDSSGNYSTSNKIRLVSLR